MQSTKLLKNVTTRLFKLTILKQAVSIGNDLFLSKQAPLKFLDAIVVNCKGLQLLKPKIHKDHLKNFV